MTTRHGLILDVRTRTKVHDYVFIGGTRTGRWWEETYGRLTDFSRPTIIVEKNRLFISGIESGRTDSKGAGIHYAILGEFDDPDGATQATGLIGRACDELDRTERFQELGAELDKFGEERWSAAVNGDGGARNEVLGELISLLRESASATCSRDTPTASRWVRSLKERDAFKELARTAAVVVNPGTREEGLAAYLNLASTMDLSTIQRRPGPSGIVCRRGATGPKPSPPSAGGYVSQWPPSF